MKNIDIFSDDIFPLIPELFNLKVEISLFLSQYYLISTKVLFMSYLSLFLVITSLAIPASSGCISMPVRVDMDKAKTIIKVDVEGDVYFTSKNKIKWSQNKLVKISDATHGLFEDTLAYHVYPNKYPTSTQLIANTLEDKQVSIQINFKEPALSFSEGLSNAARGTSETSKGGCGSQKIDIKYE